jgi:hypothetical protein
VHRTYTISKAGLLARVTKGGRDVLAPEGLQIAFNDTAINLAGCTEPTTTTTTAIEASWRVECNAAAVHVRVIISGTLKFTGELAYAVELNEGALDAPVSFDVRVALSASIKGALWTGLRVAGQERSRMASKFCRGANATDFLWDVAQPHTGTRDSSVWMGNTLAGVRVHVRSSGEDAQVGVAKNTAAWLSAFPKVCTCDTARSATPEPDRCYAGVEHWLPPACKLLCCGT